MTSVEQVADGLREANVAGYIEGREFVYGMLPEFVHVYRTPSWNDDGPQAREDWVGYGRTEIVAFRNAMPDFHQEDITTSVDGNRISLDRTICGTLADGTELRILISNVYTVEDDQITRIDVDLDPASVARIRAALQSGGVAPEKVASFITLSE